MPFKIGVVRFPGTNCDSETKRALVENIPEANISFLSQECDELSDLDAVVLPGGFSYGDYLRAGAIAARAPIGRALKDYAAKGGVILGICNGFQQLQELGLLPGALVKNESGRFYCGSVKVIVDGSQSAATKLINSGQRCSLPVAHGEGRFWCDEKTLKKLEANGQIVLRYAEGNNPNGSLANIAGISNTKGNVVGMMPHPERNADGLQGSGEGSLFLRSLGAFLERGHCE